MDIVIKFKGVDYNSGELVEHKHTFNSDVDFYEKTYPNKAKEIALNNGYDSTLLDDKITVSVYEQALLWVDERDNSDIIHAYNLSHIIDYDIISVGSNILKKDEDVYILKNGDKRISKGSEYELPNHDMEAEKVIILLDIMVENDQIKTDFLAVYKEIYETIKGLSFDKQFSIVLKSTSVAYKSATNTLKELSEYNERLKNIPRVVWRDAERQGRCTVSEYIKNYMETENYKNLIEN